jgi:trehalose synthase
MRSHLQPLPLGRRALDDYAPDERLARIRALAEPLRGLRVLHLTAAGSRLRSPEILPSLLALHRDLGLEAELWALAGDRPLWQLVRQLEDGLQGGETAISDDAWAGYLESTRETAAGRLDDWDVVVAHGPGPLAVAVDGPAMAVLRLELDASAAEAGAWARLAPLVEECAALFVSSAAYFRPGFGDRVVEAPEAIDPLAPGAVDLPVTLAGSMLRSFGVDTSRPCCCQLRPFDTWQDPHDVLDAFALAKAELPELQLVLAGDPARGDLEGWQLLREMSEYASERPDVILLTGPGGLGSVELGALRRVSRVALESTMAPSSALTTLETLWAGTPVISEGRRGAAHPVRDGREGYLTDSPESMAARLVELVGDPGLAIELGGAGRELVQERFLITRLLEDELVLLGRERTGDPASL